MIAGIEYGIHIYIEDNVDICKAYLPNEGDKEMDTVNKKKMSLCSFTRSFGICNRLPAIGFGFPPRFFLSMLGYCCQIFHEAHQFPVPSLDNT